MSHALRTGEIRLYAPCHVVGWEASDKEIFLLHEYLEAGWSEEMQEACRQIDFENSADDREPVFVHTEMMQQLRMKDATGYLSAAPLACTPEENGVQIADARVRRNSVSQRA